jgi:hypothetical protein
MCTDSHSIRHFSTNLSRMPHLAAPAAIVIMYMKHGTLPVASMGRALEALDDLQARNIIARVPAPVMADWNAYELRPRQATELLLAVHHITADGQPGELVVELEIA